ncbi:MAG: hypothetical protein WC503_06315 [Candidatus Shapirobacteria bacterium]
MIKKIFIFCLIIFVSTLIVSLIARDVDQAKLQLTDKITNINQNPNINSEASQDISPTTITEVEPTLTDQQIETELNSGAPIDVDIEADFSSLEAELNQL